MVRLYIYKMVVDNGGAPCVTSNPKLLSLALCKPAIRRTAEKGDIIFGFAGNEMKEKYPGNPLIYLAEIAAAICGERYYSNSEFLARPDCVYVYDGRSFRHRGRAKSYHSNADRDRDIGEQPAYMNARVLLSEKFRYFGSCGPQVAEERWPHLAELLKSMMDGHRVNHAAALRGDILRFKEFAWRKRGLACSPVLSHDRPHSCGGDQERVVTCS
jgi:hypothetical protein